LFPLQTVHAGEFTRLLVQIPQDDLLSGRRDFPDDANSQRYPRVGFVNGRFVTLGAGKRIAPAGNQVQATGLVGAFRPSRTTRTNVPFLNQPEFQPCRAGTLDPDANELFQQTFQRPLPRDIQKQVRREPEIKGLVKPAVTRCFHDS
jgi:hypothetical protein